VSIALDHKAGLALRRWINELGHDLSAKTSREYEQAISYHDGKWLLLDIDTDRAVKDAMLLLAAKRRPVKVDES
jgi:hypothetical protein